MGFCARKCKLTGVSKTSFRSVGILIISAYLGLDHFKNNPSRREGLAFLLKASKSIVFSFAFTSVSDADVRKNFVSFQKELLPFLVKAAL